MASSTDYRTVVEDLNHGSTTIPAEATTGAFDSGLPSLKAGVEVTDGGVGTVVTVNLTGTGGLPPNIISNPATPDVAGITVNEGTVNFGQVFDIAGAPVGDNDVITIGNGNNEIIDGSISGSVAITVGTGANYIDIHTGTGAGIYSVTLGSHTATSGADAIYVSEIGTFNGAAVVNTTITGAAAGDILNFASAATSATNATYAQQTAITAAPSLSAAVALAFADTPAANGALSFLYGGNTYVIDQAGAAGSAQVAADSVIELAGMHTLTAGAVTNGHVVLASPPDYSTIIEDLYAIYLNRQSDIAGMQNFEVALTAGNAPTTFAGLAAAYGSNAAVTAVINSFGDSAEFTTRYAQELSSTNGTGTLSASAASSLVSSIFENELGRAPLETELTFWSNGITTGALTVSDAVLSIAAAAMTNPVDASALNNTIAVVNAFNASSQTLTLNAGVIYGSNTAASGNTTIASAAIGGATGVVVAAGADNAYINVNLAGAAAGYTDKITVGNGNDFITDGSIAGSVMVAVGSGANYIDIHTGTGAGTYTVTLGAHVASTDSDLIYTSEIGTFAGAAVANTTIANAVAGDVLEFASAATSAANVTAAQQAVITSAASLSAAVALAFADTTATNQALSFEYRGNTYVIEQAGGMGAAQAANDSIIELAGVHTLAAGAVTDGHVVLMASPADYSTVIGELYAIYYDIVANASAVQSVEAALMAADAPTTLAGLDVAYGNNAGVTTIINSFAGTESSTQSSPNNATSTLSASAASSIVNGIFEYELGRAPLQAGLTFWSNAISSGALAVADAVISIAAAALTNPADVTAITNKIALANAFDASSQTLVLNASESYGGDVGVAGYAINPSPAIGGTTGVTVAAVIDNAHINVNLVGAAAGYTDKITVGNGNDYITDGSIAGSVTVTVGTGSNYIDIHTGKAAGVYTVTLGTHTAPTANDFIYTSEIGSFGGAAVANTTITGTVAGDVLGFASAATMGANVTTTQQTAITSATSLSAAVALAFSDTFAMNEALAFQYGGNTYVVTQSGGISAAQAPNDSIVELVGLHTLTAGPVTGGHVVLAS